MQTEHQTAHAVSITRTRDWYANLVLTPALDGEPDEGLLLLIAADAEAMGTFHDGREVSGQVEYRGELYEYQLRFEFNSSDLVVEASL